MRGLTTACLAALLLAACGRDDGGPGGDGEQIREYLTEPRVLQPPGTTTLFVKQSDTSGCLGANFLIEWVAEGAVTEPVMIGQREVPMGAFRSPGQVVEERGGGSD